MSASLKQTVAPAKPAAATQTHPHRAGPSRRRRRANQRLGTLVALCSMAAWGVVGLMPIIAALYACYGY